jgi:hypothetical protein
MGANQQTYNMPYTYSTRTITDHDTIASGWCHLNIIISHQRNI